MKLKTCKICNENDQEKFRPGEGWTCHPCVLEQARLYRQTPAYKATKARYVTSAKGLATTRAREERPDVREKRRQASASPQGHANQQKYAATPKGKATHLRAITKFLKTEKGKTYARARDKRRAKTPARQLKMIGYHAKYLRTDKGKATMAKRNARRYAWVMETPYPLTPDQWIAILIANKYRCYYCKKKRQLTMDHVIPLSKGGKHTASNIVPACLSCNSSKHDKILTLL
jgi:5-methylcytosine-specific restriction endonuclease McrA